MNAPYVIRAAGARDLADFCALRSLAGPGFTSFMVEDDVLAARLDKSAKSFASKVRAPGDERYLLALEAPDGRVAGSVGVKATIGAAPPFFNFRIVRIAQASASAGRRFDMSMLILVNEFTGATEVGSLFVRPEHRAGGMGRMLAQARYVFMAAAPHRFNDRVVSELRGVVHPDGRAPLWEHLGRHFFRMSFQEADRLSATGDSQFILDLMPRSPIYCDLLQDEAREVIGECHPDGRGARKLLEWEGFRFDNVVDIFDGGPLLSVSRDAIRTLRETRRVPLIADEAIADARAALIASPDVSSFRCAPAKAAFDGGAAHVHPAVLEAIGLESGDIGLAWISADAS